MAPRSVTRPTVAIATTGETHLRDTFAGLTPTPNYARATLDEMATTTIRLSVADEALLDLLSPEFGDRSSVIRAALRHLALDHHRKDALGKFLADWDAEDGPVTDEEIAVAATRYSL